MNLDTERTIRERGVEWFNQNSSSELILCGYLCVLLVAGIFVGWLAYKVWKEEEHFDDTK